LSYINVSQFSECMESLTNSHPTGECEHQCWSSINAHAAHTQNATHSLSKCMLLSKGFHV